jgi:hypothetical protein
MFPLTREHWQAVSPYLEHAMEMSGDERRALLVTLRASKANLASMLEALLDEHAMLQHEGFLERDAVPGPQGRDLAATRAQLVKLYEATGRQEKASTFRPPGST